MDKLYEAIPYVMALIILVYIFLKAMAERDRFYIDAQSSRDKLYVDAQKARDELFISSQKENNEMVRKLTAEIREISERTISHDMNVMGELNKISKTRKPVRTAVK